MKKIMVVFIFLLLAIVTDSFAKNLQVSKAGFVIQNTSATTSANVAFEFYNPDGSSEHAINLTIAPHSSSLIDLDDLKEITPGWSGSAIITSDTPVLGACFTETFSTYGKPEGTGWNNLSTPGGGPHTFIFVPQISKDTNTGFNFNLWVQNAGTSTATINVTYNAYDGLNFYSSTCPDLAPGASFNSNNSCLPNLPDSFVGSAVVSSDQPLAVVANQSNTVNMTECLYNGIPAILGNVDLFFPIVQNNYQGWYSSFTVQNMAASQAQSVFSYHADCGNACNWESPLPSSIEPDLGHVFTPVTDSFSGYGKVTSDVPVGGVAWIWNNSAKTGYCYNSIGGPVSVESIWFIPSVKSDSRIVVKNTSETTSGTIYVSWSDLPGQQTMELAANDKQVITPAVPDGWSGNGVVQSTGLPLAIMVQNSQLGGNDLGTYYASGNNDGDIKLYVPWVRKAEPFQSTIWKVYNPAILKSKKVEK